MDCDWGLAGTETNSSTGQASIIRQPAEWEETGLGGAESQDDGTRETLSST